MSLAHVIDSEDMSRQMKFCQVAQGLTYLHDHDVANGDIKRLNILLSDGAQIAKVYNFGLILFKCHLKVTKIEDGFQGTDMYLAPVMLIKGPKSTKASDMWAFGASHKEIFADEHFWEIEANTPSFAVAIV